MVKVAKVTAKGQITIPAEVRQEMGIEKGDQVVFYMGLNGSMHMRVRRPRKGAGSRSFSWPEAPRAPAEVRDAIAAELEAKHAVGPNRASPSR
jgi:AbrB family looped-hinge helix DNA binding protein